MPTVSIQSKLGQIPPSVFSAMSQLAAQHQAINLGQGFPDFEMDATLQNLVHRAMQDGHNQYAHSFGFQGLREILARKIENLYHLRANPDLEITITPGGTYAISNALTAVLRPGDEVIIFEPCFDSYIPNIEIMGAKAVCIPLRFPHFDIDWALVRAAITPRTRMIMLNSPHNPSGAVLKLSDIEELQAVVDGTDILILSDEVYEHLTFDGEKHHSILANPALWDRAFVAFSLGKVFHCTGWKVGYTVAPAYLMREFRNHHQFNVFSVNTPMQVAMAQYLTNPQVYLGLSPFFQRKRDLFLELMKDVPLRPIHSKGSYFQCFTFEQRPGFTDLDLCRKWVEEAGVAAIPISSFYKNQTDNGVVRFCFAKTDETLKAAAERLKSYRW